MSDFIHTGDEFCRVGGLCSLWQKVFIIILFISLSFFLFLHSLSSFSRLFLSISPLSPGGYHFLPALSRPHFTSSFFVMYFNCLHASLRKDSRAAFLLKVSNVNILIFSAFMINRHVGSTIYSPSATIATFSPSSSSRRIWWFSDVEQGQKYQVRIEQMLF